MQLQLIEVAIGLVAAFFIVSLIASAVVEICSIWFKKRSKDLQIVLDTMLSTGSANAIDLTSTSIYRAMLAASRRKRGPAKERDQRGPSYMSARSFADGVVEGLVQLKSADQTVQDAIHNLPDGPLKQRITTLIVEVGDDLVAIKAGLEGWFDDTMDRLEGAYKRWSQWFLLAVGIVLACVLNVSAVRIIDSLWNDPTLRSAVAESAVNDLTDRPCPDDKPDCSPEEKIANAISDLDGLDLPVGWTDDWAEESGGGWTILGFLVTGGAVMLGAQFWFDLLTRLAGARAGRGVPPKAMSDRGSATVEVTETGPSRSHRSFLNM
jgi:hypothetical protein